MARTAAPTRPRQGFQTDATPDANAAVNAVVDRQVRALADSVAVTDRLHQQRQAELAGVDPDVWERITDPNVRARLLAADAPTLGDYLNGKDIRPSTSTIADGGNMRDAVNRAGDLLDQLTDPDDPKKIRVWDAPVEGFHRSFTWTTQEQLRDRLNEGCVLTPIAPIFAEPTIPCGLVTRGGKVCPKHLYSDDEVEAHQRTKHRDEYASAMNRRQRERDEQQLKQSQLLTEAMQRLVSGPAPATADDRIAALEAQIAALSQQVKPAPADDSP